MIKFKKPVIKRSPTKAIKLLEKIGAEMNETGRLKVGLPKGSNNYPDGTSVIMVGTVHEFGSPSRNIPERSFLRSTMHMNGRFYKKLLEKLAKKIMKGDMTSSKAMNILGLQVESDVKARITDLSEPALKHREGNPLVDTGHLRQSIVYVVGE